MTFLVSTQASDASETGAARYSTRALPVETGSEHRKFLLVTIVTRSSFSLRLALFIVSTAFLVTGCASTNYVSVRKSPHDPLASALRLVSRGGPKPTARTEQLLRRYDLADQQKKHSPVVLASLEQEVVNEPSSEKIYSLAEVAYVNGKRAEGAGREDEALDNFGISVTQAYQFLFDPVLDRARNPYDPQFRQACDLYNGALEASLRILQRNGKLRPGERHTIKTGKDSFDLAIEVRGNWHPEDFERLEFVSDYEIEGLTNQYHTYGLGVPLIAIRRPHPHGDPAERYYPQGLAFPVTAFLRVHRPSGDVAHLGQVAPQMHCVLELHDPLFSDHLAVGQRVVPLETDLTTPLAYFLDGPAFRTGKLATLGLLNPASTQTLEGIYMVEPYDPHKIPVLMVHGLWSSPTTWMEMFNDLRALPEIREKFQFWFYLYPTGQPFWISAAKLREDLAKLHGELDAPRASDALQHMVLVGHSMGGLVSRMQTVESGENYWHIISDQDFSQLKADHATREKLARILFFHPDPAVRRVVTIGTPHRGSDFANDYTRYIGRQLITLPTRMVQAGQRLLMQNPGFFKNTDLLTITNSIDSLSPESPIFPVLRRSTQAPWVKQHNIAGLISEKSLFGRITESGDGIVSFDSAHLDDIESELVVPAGHSEVHRHPRSVLELRRILLEHLEEYNAERAAATTQPTAPPRELGNLSESRETLSRNRTTSEFSFTR